MRKENYWGLVLGIVFLISLVMVIVAAVITIKSHISLNNNFTALKNRAQVAANADDMYSLLVKLDGRMEDRGMTSGYASEPWNHNDWTNMTQIRANLKNLIARAEEVKNIDHGTDAYQSGLDDLRGNLREFDLQVIGWWGWNDGLVWYILGPFFTGLLVLDILIYLKRD